MAIKRKRSLSSLSSPHSSSSSMSCSSSSFLSRDPSSSPSIDHEHRIDLFLEDDTLSTQFSMDINPSHLSSRTRKRFRNSRPAERQVHEHTLNLLFKAQAQSPPPPEPQVEAQPVPTEPPSMQPPSSHARPMSAASQRSLHSFWALPTRPASAHVYMLMDTTMAVESQAQCEDCDARLPSEEAFDAMDVDGQTGYQCRGCSRQICDACAVAADDGRKCLQCYAGHGLGKRWVGGIGWM